MSTNYNTTDLRALIDRLERLTGPDREVDEALLVLEVPRMADILPHWTAAEREQLVDQRTASLDVALALVERLLRPVHPGMTITLKGTFSGPGSDFWRAEITWPSSERQGRSRVAPCALLAALLRALDDPR